MDAGELSTSSASGRRSDEPRDKPAKRILLVEDEGLIAMAEAELLASCGYRIVLASDGPSAIETFRTSSQPIDLVIIDVELGVGLDGAEVARRILADREVPILFLSSHDEAEVVSRTESLSSYGYVLKSSGISVLDASIKTAFRLFETRRAIASGQAAQAHAAGAISRPNGAQQLRAWEQDCLREAVGILDDRELSMEAALQALADRIPASWMRRSSTCARISVDGKAYRSALFIDSPWKTASGIRIGDRVAGALEVCHLDSSAGGEAFPDEERLVVELLARWIGLSLESREHREVLRENEARYRRMSEALTDYIYTVRYKGSDIAQAGCGPGCLAVTGYTEDELAASPGLFQGMIVPEERAAVAAHVAMVRAGVQVGPIEYRITRKDGSLRWVRDTQVRVVDRNGDLQGYDGLVQDISGQRLAEAALAETEREKDAYFRGVKHRMNNVLSIIVSLLGLEAGKTDDAAVRDFVLATERRICALSTLFEILLGSDTPDSIKLDDYLARLATSFMEMESLRSHALDLDLDLAPVSLDPGRAIPLGLIAAELLSNAIKHAYPGEGEGRISLGLALAEGSAVMSVADKGVGLPEGLDPGTSESTGLTLIRLLTEQLGGKAGFENEGGTTAKVTFGLEAPSGYPAAPAIRQHGSAM
jgi:PAS domain S-box-containing protein